MEGKRLRGLAGGGGLARLPRRAVNVCGAALAGESPANSGALPLLPSQSRKLTLTWSRSSGGF